MQGYLDGTFFKKEALGVWWDRFLESRKGAPIYFSVRMDSAL
jgi:hypothetical protein